MRGHLDAFFKIAGRWHLTQAEGRALLGPPTDERWFHFIHDAAPSITPEELARVRAVIQIDEVLSDCLSEPREAARWLRTIEMAPPFFGRTPLALLFRGMEGFEAITGYLEARRPAERTPRLP